MEQLNTYQDGSYVFHGTNSPDIAAFEPRQAYSFNKPDGEPGVYASSKLEPAVFMAIIGSRKTGGMGMKNGTTFGFYILESDMEMARDEQWSGFVYVFRKQDFVQRQGWEWKTTQIVQPVFQCGVNFTDLPQPIEVMKSSDFFEYINQTLQ